MTLPPCYTNPYDDENPAEEPVGTQRATNATPPGGERADQSDSPPDPSRRRFLFGSAAATTGLLVAPILLSREAGAAEATRASTSSDPNAHRVTLEVNGKAHTLELDPRTTLLDALREELKLTGTKKGCDQGACGACTVLVDGRRVNSCLTLALMHAGRKITTIEGLAEDGRLHPVQAAFIAHDGFQCGYCTPGQICSAVALIREGHTKSDEEIREWMSGNICRCGAYVNIVDAIREAQAKGGGRVSF